MHLSFGKRDKVSHNITRGLRLADAAHRYTHGGMLTGFGLGLGRLFWRRRKKLSF